MLLAFIFTTSFNTQLRIHILRIPHDAPHAILSSSRVSALVALLDFPVPGWLFYLITFLNVYIFCITSYPVTFLKTKDLFPQFSFRSSPQDTVNHSVSSLGSSQTWKPGYHSCRTSFRFGKKVEDNEREWGSIYSVIHNYQNVPSPEARQQGGMFPTDTSSHHVQILPP